MFLFNKIHIRIGPMSWVCAQHKFGWLVSCWAQHILTWVPKIPNVHWQHSDEPTTT